MSAPIFISYSSRDQQIAETICQALEARGQACWISCRNVRAGENFQEAIVRALRDAKVMLLVFSSNANNSEEIKKELVLAGRHHVTVVPARVEDVIPNDAFSYELATRQWVDLFTDWEQEIEQLSAQIAQILAPVADAGTEAKIDVAPHARAMPPSRSNVAQSSNRPLIVGLALGVLMLAIAAAFYFKPSAPPAPQAVRPAPPVQMSAQTPAPAPAQTTPPAPVKAAAPPAATPAPPAAPLRAPVKAAKKAAPLPQPVAAPPAAMVSASPAAPSPVTPPPPANPDETAWQAAVSAGTHAGFSDYLKSYAAGTHAQEAQMRLAMSILAEPATGTDFDGQWQTTWTCPNLGQYPGYSYQFTGQFKDGSYHGLKGVKGEPSSMTLDGKIEADGAAAFSGEVIVGSSLVGLGAARGSASDFHALAQFDRGIGSGKRLEGRACSLMFQKL